MGMRNRKFGKVPALDKHGSTHGLEFYLRAPSQGQEIIPPKEYLNGD